MVITKQNVMKGFNLLLGKMAGAGLLFFIMSIFLMLSSEVDDMYEFVEGIAVFFWWIILFSLTTLLIDLIVYKFQIEHDAETIVLYFIGGILFFFINPMGVWIPFISILGIVCSLIIFISMKLSFQSKVFKYVFSIIVPLTLLIIINIDFTEKEGWVDVRTSSSYEATFDYFNGKQEIPVELNPGDTMTLSVNFGNENGGYRFYVLNKFGQKVGQKKVDEEQTKFTAKLNGDYRFIVIGDELKGSFKINWSIDENN